MMAGKIFTILQGNVSFNSVGIRDVHRLTVYQYRYIGELHRYSACTHQQEV